MICPECKARLMVTDSRPGDRAGFQERRLRCQKCAKNFYSHEEFSVSSLRYRVANAQAVQRARQRTAASKNPSEMEL